MPAPAETGRVTRRLLGGAVVAGALLLVWLSGAVDDQVELFLRANEALLRDHAVLGKVVFTLLAGASAMLAFFSSAVLVPGAIAAWGVPATFALLWLGWIIGGVTAYTVGRSLGRAVVVRLTSPDRLAFYEGRVRRDVSWWMLLLLQLALPSELPGYLSGVLRVPPRRYLAALALGELPYAVGSVVLGEAVVERNTLVFLGVAVGGVALFAVAWRVLHARLARDTSSSGQLGAARGGGREEPAPEEHRESCPPELPDEEAGHVHQPDAGEGVGEGARHRHRGVGERRRGREPVGSPDPRGHREGSEQRSRP